MQERPPEGAPVRSKHYLTFYVHQLAEGSPEGKPLPYNYAMSHLGHEMGHRWAAYVSAKVNGETTLLALGPTGRRDCRPLFHSPISGPRRHPPLEGASGRTTSTERTRSSMTATSCRQRVIRILTCT